MTAEENVSKTEIRIKALENELGRTRAEIKQLMLDIRALLMEAGSPLRGQILNLKVSGQVNKSRE